MRGFRGLGAALVAHAALAIPTGALACSPLPQPPLLEGETAEAYAARQLREIEATRVAAETRLIAHEADLLATSERIVLARVAAITPALAELAPARPGRRPEARSFSDIRLLVVAQVRGNNPQQFNLRHQSHTPGLCDFRGSPESLDGLLVGDLVLVFAGAGDLSQATFREAVPQSRAMTPAMQALFDRGAGPD